MEMLQYGDTMVAVPLKEEQIVAVIRQNPVELPACTPEQAVRDALDMPIGAPPLEQVVAPGDTVCIVISDITRRWQAPAMYLPILVERLNRAGVPDENILVLSATGVHRTQTEAEWRTLLGPELLGRLSYTDHECDDRANLTYLGETSRGTPVWVNSRALHCDKLILTGGVAYHPLAGFSGGRKSLVPGIAGRETIDRNHALALAPGFGSGIHPHATGGDITAENPFHDDQVEASAMARPAYVLNVVANGEGRIVRAFAGHWMRAWEAAVQLVEAMDGVPVRGRVPLVVASTGGPPKDMNISQTTKTLANALHLAAPGGTIILLSQCREGFGDPACREQICGYDTMEQRERALREHFSIGGFFGYLFADSAEKFNLILVTDMAAENFGRTRIHAVKTLAEALAVAAQLNGGSLEGIPTALMPKGGSTLPKVQGEYAPQ